MARNDARGPQPRLKDCERCGSTFHMSELAKDASGFLVCKTRDCFDEAHPRSAA